MSLDWFYKLGDWNPQFFREFKGRLKPRTLSITIFASLLMQLTVMAYFWLALPGPESYTSRWGTGPIDYSGRRVLLDHAGNVIVNWQLWWSDIFTTLSWALPFVVIVAGVYMLIGDLGKEERRGTLNFIRLSPQSSQRILLGKLLGVPIVPYLAVAVAVPLHLFTAVKADIPVSVVVSIYVFTAAIAACYFIGSLLFAFLGGVQGWVGAIVVWFTFMFFFQLWVAFKDYNNPYMAPPWYFGIEVGVKLGLSLAFWVVTTGVATFWLWKAVNRRYRNPATTLLSKGQSYLMTACFEFWLLGLMIRPRSMYEDAIDDFLIVMVINLLWFGLLMAALMPQRQTLLDWARYRRERVSSGKKFWSRSIVKDLIWGEKSPALLAIALNLLIAATMFTPWIISWNVGSEQLKAIGALGFATVYMMICAAIAQIIMLMKTPKRAGIAAGTLLLITAVPPMILGTLSMYPAEVPLIWLFSAFAFPAFGYASAMELCFSILTQLGVFTLLTMQLTKQLRKAGESELKALMAGQDNNSRNVLSPRN